MAIKIGKKLYRTSNLTDKVTRKVSVPTSPNNPTVHRKEEASGINLIVALPYPTLPHPGAVSVAAGVGNWEGTLHVKAGFS